MNLSRPYILLQSLQNLKENRENSQQHKAQQMET